MIGDGDALWATGEWSDTGQGQTGSPIEAKGYWGVIYNREGRCLEDPNADREPNPGTGCDIVLDGQP